MHTIIDGIRLAFDDAGVGDPAVVLLHGFPLDRTIWDAQFAALAQRTRVVRVDLRGAGESGCGAGPALMETLAGDVYGLLDALDIARSVLVGHSMGGYAALAFFRMYAERVAGLGLVASHVAADTPARARERVEQAERILAHGFAPLLEAIVAGAVAPGFEQAQPATIERLRAIVGRADPAGAAAQVIGMKERVDSSDLLADIAVPALIVAGAADRFIAPAVLGATAAALVDCEFVTLPGVGHLPMLEAPDATTAALERLVARCVTVTSAAGPHSARAARA